MHVMPRIGNNRKVVCLCDCGTESTVYQANLVSGRTLSCGCFRSEKVSKMNITHGESGNYYHDVKASAEYNVWRWMKERCFNPKAKRYSRYGGRGITVCDAWVKSFETFLCDMGRRPSHYHQIERNDNDGNYEPSNCRWATRSEQQQNTSRSKFVILNGRKVTISAAARSMGIHRATAQKRLVAA